ncbi:MAG TPA: hypothetical protein VFT87_03655 [Candidatus Saccharimonadales bacterium]|nr:hypothetical protein [Candidatus Saccharimonadales bacterium]
MQLLSTQITEEIGKMKEYPQIKFLKAAVPEILDGRKTAEARPRSVRWIDKISNAEIVELTWGARFATPTVFARARLEQVDVKTFAEATQEDVKRFGGRWHDVPVARFVTELEQWYAKELLKGHPVAWIYFTLI